MPTQRQFGVQLEGGLADQASVHLARLHPVVDLPDLEFIPILEPDPQLGGRPVGHVHRQSGGSAESTHNGGWQGAPPRRLVNFAK